MAQQYPDTTGFRYSYSRAELSANGRIWTAITNVSIDQPTEEEAVQGTKPGPLGRSVGTMGLGEGTVTFSDEGERMDFIDSLGDGFREKIWGLVWILRGPTGGEKRIECIGCRVLGNPIEHESGAAPLGGDISFSFMSHKINGKSPHLP